MNIKQNLIYLRDLRDLYRAREMTAAGNVSYVNWWAEDPETAWMTKLVRSVCPETEKKIRFYSMFGPRKNVSAPFDGVRIFYCGENLEERVRFSELTEREEKVKGWEHRRRTYCDYCQPITDLSIGFGYHSEWANYVRFPLWIMRYFEPDWGLDQIRIKIEVMERQPVDLQRRGAALIASHDFMGTRAGICDQINKTVEISYAGKWRNTTDSLWTEYQNDKEAYLRHFRFSICPENTDAPGYVTEKVFDAIAAGTIPVYHGDSNHPEPDILNPDSIVLWDYAPEKQKEQTEFVRRLAEDDEFYQNFMQQPKFRPDAAEQICKNMQDLRERLKEVIKSGES